MPDPKPSQPAVSANDTAGEPERADAPSIWQPTPDLPSTLTDKPWRL